MSPPLFFSHFVATHKFRPIWPLWETFLPVTLEFTLFANGVCGVRHLPFFFVVFLAFFLESFVHRWTVPIWPLFSRSQVNYKISVKFFCSSKSSNSYRFHTKCPRKPQKCPRANATQTARNSDCCECPWHPPGEPIPTTEVSTNKEIRNETALQRKGLRRSPTNVPSELSECRFEEKPYPRTTLGGLPTWGAAAVNRVCWLAKCKKLRALARSLLVRPPCALKIWTESCGVWIGGRTKMMNIDQIHVVLILLDLTNFFISQTNWNYLNF